MSDWNTQVSNLQKTLDEIKIEVKENRSAIQSLKQELATGKGSIKAVMWIGGAVGALWTIMKILKLG
jgi:peptidoglycan hydrolase CwlO-like protein